MTSASVRPGQPWLDTDGNRIHAHGGSVITRARWPLLLVRRRRLAAFSDPLAESDWYVSAIAGYAGQAWSDHGAKAVRQDHDLRTGRDCLQAGQHDVMDVVAYSSVAGVSARLRDNRQVRRGLPNLWQLRSRDRGGNNLEPGLQKGRRRPRAASRSPGESAVPQRQTPPRSCAR